MTVDGCSMECVRKIVEKSGYEVSTATSLVRDFSIKKVSLDKDLAGIPEPVLEHISQDDLDRATMAIVSAVVRKG